MKTKTQLITNYEAIRISLGPQEKFVRGSEAGAEGGNNLSRLKRALLRGEREPCDRFVT